MAPSRVTTSPRPTSRRSPRFCLGWPRWAIGALSWVLSMKVAKFVMSNARPDRSRPNSVTIGVLMARSAQPIVGIRHLIHREDDPDWVLRKDVSAGLELPVERGLAFDVCAESIELLARVPVLAERHPGLRLVIDHPAQPLIASVGWQPWADLLSESAAGPNVTAKISGLNTAAVPGWTSTSQERRA